MAVPSIINERRLKAGSIVTPLTTFLNPNSLSISKSYFCLDQRNPQLFFMSCVYQHPFHIFPLFFQGAEVGWHNRKEV